jgi:hypothetical protein
LTSRKVAAKGNLRAWVENNQAVLGFDYHKAKKMMTGYNRFGDLSRQREYLTEEDAQAISRGLGVLLCNQLHKWNFWWPRAGWLGGPVTPDVRAPQLPLCLKAVV